MTAISDTVKSWVLNIALKKAVVSAAKLVVSWAISHGVTMAFSIGGVVIDTTNEGAMTIAINSGLTVVRNYLKTKWPAKFGWL